MTWNYRIVRHRHTMESGYSYDWYGVHEIYYEDGKITGWIDSPVTLDGDSLEDIVDLLKLVEKDINNSPILDEKELPRGKENFQ